MAFAAISLGVSAISTGLSAYGAVTGAKAAKQQAQLNQAASEQQAALGEFNATQIERYGAVNADMVRTIAGLNNTVTKAVSDTNIALIGATTDFNIGVIGATTDFNVASATGAGKILEAQGEAASQAHTFNAGIAEVQAQDVTEQGNQAERQSRTAYSQLKGRQRAALAANGVTLDEGSSLRMQSDTDYASDVDASVIKSNALKAALGYRVTAANETMSASMASLNAKGAAAEKYAEAVSAKINGVTDSANAKIGGAVKSLDTAMTASFQILNNTIDSSVQAMNIEQNTAQSAWNARAAAAGYSSQGAAYGAQAGSINPMLAGGTSLLAGAAQVAGQWYTYSKAGAAPAPKGP